MFADDTAFTNAGKRINSLACRDINKRTKWFDSNKLTIITGKCETIHFERGRPENIVLEDQTLVLKSTCQNLGIHIHPQLFFRDRIDHVVRKHNMFYELY